MRTPSFSTLLVGQILSIGIQYTAGLQAEEWFRFLVKLVNLLGI